MSRGNTATRVIAVTAAAAALALAVGGCGGPEKDASYGSVNEFRDALVAAGYDCPDWKQTDDVPSAAQSGRCSTKDKLMTFSTTDDRDHIVDTFKDFMGGLGMEVHLLVGPNWILNSADADQMQKKIGGSVVTK